MKAEVNNKYEYLQVESSVHRILHFHSTLEDGRGELNVDGKKELHDLSNDHASGEAWWALLEAYYNVLCYHTNSGGRVNGMLGWEATDAMFHKVVKRFPHSLLMKDIICWWSGGVTSALACKLTADIYGLDRCRFILIDTGNEDEDTYRFKTDCERWYGKEIETIGSIGTKYEDIKAVWYKFKSLNVANGAICSSELKREVRKRFQRDTEYAHQVFGFDMGEPNRAKAMAINYPDSKPLFPLLMYGIGKKKSIEMIEAAGVEVPRAYRWGFHNNNCLNTGCVQGGIGYWQLMKIHSPEKYDAMADVEHDLTNLRGEPVTMLKDQSKAAKASGKWKVFLKPHPDFPDYSDLSMMSGREVKPLMECNGFCGVNDLVGRNDTADELNFEED
jgi:hypothetical protein